MAITILVRNPNAGHEGCRILYRDIGDYLKREDKLALLREAGSIAGIDDWRTNRARQAPRLDWPARRGVSGALPDGVEGGESWERGGDDLQVVFKQRLGKTSRDTYIYNFSREACAANARAMVGDYLGALAGVDGRWGRRAESGCRRNRHPSRLIRHVSGGISELKERIQRRRDLECFVFGRHTL